jgi:DEAD/DEAH box helicase domain-containing protein
VEKQQRNAAWMGFLMIPSTADDKVAADAQRAPWLQQLPLQIREPGSGFAPVTSKENGATSVVGWWPMLLAKGLPLQADWRAPGIVLLDAAAAPEGETLHLAWRRWLQLFNILQFLPDMCLATADGLAAHDYDGLGSAGLGTSPAGPAKAVAINAAWQAVVEQTLDALLPGFKRLAQAGVEPPEVGLELTDTQGRVLADCELAWAQGKLVVLRPDQADLIEVWSGESWKVVLLDDGLSFVGGTPWEVTVAVGMELELTMKEGEVA